MNYKIVGIILIVIILISGCSLESSGNNKLDNKQDSESTYDDILELISNEEWETAASKLNVLESDYRGVKVLKSIVNSNIELSKVSGNELSDYDLVIKEMRKIPNTYKDIHSDLVNQYKKLLYDRISSLELNTIAQDIKQKEYDKALVQIQNSIFIYLDRSYIVMNKYAFAKKMKESGEDQHYRYFLFEVPVNYTGTLHEEIRAEKNEIIASVTELIDQEKYEDAIHIINIYFSDTIPDEATTRDYSLTPLRVIINLKQDKNNIGELLDIPDDYEGFMSDEINNLKLKHKAELEKIRRNNAIYNIKIREENERANNPPQIGMTAEEVRSSSWGEPEDINKTTTKLGVSEQWVYTDRYLYFNDGELIAIQE